MWVGAMGFVDFIRTARMPLTRNDTEHTGDRES